MFIHAVTTVVTYQQGWYDSIEAFREAYPNAEIYSINGTRANKVCPEGHPLESDGRPGPCEVCRQNNLIPCEECGKLYRECTCCPF